ncbi:hypothetical protein HY251_20415, partial [bacterium]|nr:hypothetical protein [bacterium]
LSFQELARGDLAFRRWDVTIAECVLFPELLPWPRGEELLDTGSWKAPVLEAA